MRRECEGEAAEEGQELGQSQAGRPRVARRRGQSAPRSSAMGKAAQKMPEMGLGSAQTSLIPPGAAFMSHPLWDAVTASLRVLTHCGFSWWPRDAGWAWHGRPQGTGTRGSVPGSATPSQELRAHAWHGAGTVCGCPVRAVGAQSGLCVCPPALLGVTGLIFPSSPFELLFGADSEWSLGSCWNPGSFLLSLGFGASQNPPRAEPCKVQARSRAASLLQPPPKKAPGTAHLPREAAQNRLFTFRPETIC